MDSKKILHSTLSYVHTKFKILASAQKNAKLILKYFETHKKCENAWRKGKFKEIIS